MSFKYIEYKKWQEDKKYEDAYNYASSFRRDENANICKLYSQYCMLLEKRTTENSDASEKTT